jgi:RNA polymerase sigma-70 factor (ECF subfamily)
MAGDMPDSLTPAGDDARHADRVSLDESVTRALAALLDSLTPAQRVAYVLHDVFGVPYATVAGVVGRSTRQTRDLASSARRAIRMPPPTAPGSRDGVVQAFLRAALDRDVAALSGLLAAGVMAVTDRGAAISGAAPVTGIAPVASLIFATIDDLAPVDIRVQSVNGQGGLVVARAGLVVGVICLNVVADRITDVWIVRDPDKLRSWNS